jgi:uncharacterized membrane protein
MWIRATWGIVAALALMVAAYAVAAATVPAVRTPLVIALVAAIPVIAVTHFLASALALALGAFQINARFRARRLDLHRWMGRTYIVSVILGGTSAVVMAMRSAGGLSAHAGFSLLGILWVLTAVLAYRRIREYDIADHRRWMLRSYALAFAAVTLRIQLPLAMSVFGIPFDECYPAIAWTCWVPNLVFVEWVVLPRPAFIDQPSAASLMET